MTSEMQDPADAKQTQTRREPVVYPHKASFYQDKADTERMRAAYLNTRGQTGYNSLTDLINEAINAKVTELEETYNEGRPWEPLEAGKIPRGKPAPLPAAEDPEA